MPKLEEKAKEPELTDLPKLEEKAKEPELTDLPKLEEKAKFKSSKKGKTKI